MVLNPYLLFKIMLSYVCEITLVAVTPSGNRLEVVSSCPVSDDKHLRVFNSESRSYSPVPYVDAIPSLLEKKLRAMFPPGTSILVTARKMDTKYPITSDSVVDSVVRDLFYQSFAMLDITTKNYRNEN